ncbi:acid-sensing ion channel 1 isoform X1 [Hydra vulgaris]|uniref:Hydra Na channel 4 n=2 Tax=Hydra vulgaris TaxID=6087 RepID=A8DZR8_HYDVU|nr:acid-sensing ion channel 1 isoform X3 [Hydra vulgaris]CAL36113.1 hydra Na channel 4 [Hydra vulgaris]
MNFEELAKIVVEAVQENNNQPINTNKIKTPRELRNNKTKEYVSEMIDNSSFHGISYIAGKENHFIRRTIWLLITMTAFGYAAQKVYESTVNYFSFPISTTQMRIYVNEIDFPAVSFCNFNEFRLSKMDGTKVDQAILNPKLQGLVTAEEYRNVTFGAMFDLKEMLVDCEFNGIPCSDENFTMFSWMQGERCFTFNSGKFPHKLLKIGGAGMKRSLKITINIIHYEYYKDEMDAAIHMIVHGQQDTPLKMRGPTLSPGFTTYIQLEKKMIINLEAPYKTKCGSLKLKYFDSYSLDTCWLEQLTDHVHSVCKCKDFFMPGDIPICSLNDAMSCMWPEWARFDQLKMQNCPLPCVIDSYKLSLSRALFPSPQYADSLTNSLQQPPHIINSIKNISDKVQFARDNLLRFVIYYDDLSYELIEQKPSYDTLVWLGDIGGQIGLLIGAGAMSYFEFIDCLFLVIYNQFFKTYR